MSSWHSFLFGFHSFNLLWKLSRKWFVERPICPFLRENSHAGGQWVHLHLRAHCSCWAVPCISHTRQPWELSKPGPLHLSTQKLSQDRTADPFGCPTVSLPVEKESLLFYFSPNESGSKGYCFHVIKTIKLVKYGSFYLLWMYYRLVYYICFLLHLHSQITAIWQLSGTGLFYIQMHECLQTWVSLWDLFCSCKRMHGNENYCIPLKTLSWAEEGPWQRGKIIKRNLYLRLSGSTKNGRMD